MGLRPRRRGLVVWSSGRSWAWRPGRPRRVRWFLRTGALLAVLGVMRLARGTRARWEPLFLLLGAGFMIVGFMVPAAFVGFLLGLMILVVTLLRGIAVKGRAAGQAADCWRWN
jgi:hypothetical protein